MKRRIITRVETHPRLLKHSAIPLKIVCGPPCSGKTTFVSSVKAEGDWVIDLDDISKQLDPDFQPWTMREIESLRRAINVRNLMLAKLSAATSGRAWFIVAAPTIAERSWWKLRLGGDVVLISTDAAECKRRALARGTPAAVQGVDDWFAASERPWSPPSYHKPIADDGWPFDDEN